MSIKAHIGQAVKLYRDFREADPERIGAVKVKVPKAVAVMGYVEGIDYRTTHGKKLTLYHHTFEPGSRPLLAIAADGSQILLLGGRYQFTAQGIVDKDASGRLITNPKHGRAMNPARKAPTRMQAKLRGTAPRKRRAKVQGLDLSDDGAVTVTQTARGFVLQRYGAPVFNEKDDSYKMPKVGKAKTYRTSEEAGDAAWKLKHAVSRKVFGRKS